MHRARPVVPLLLVSVFIAIVGAGCPQDHPRCAPIAESVAADSRDIMFVAARTLDSDLVKVSKRTASGQSDWTSRMSVYDNTPTRMFVPPSGGGVVVLGGGAAATRFDDEGKIVSVVGYPMAAETLGTLTSDDRVVVADVAAVRMFEGDGSASWALSLPDEVQQIDDIAADGAGGAWLLGIFNGPNLPALVDARQPGLTGGSFLIHFDREGKLVVGRAWQTGLVITDLTGGEPLIARGTAPGSAMPDFGLPADPTIGAAGPFVLALDGAGTPLWMHRELLPTLVRDGQGNLFSFTVGPSPGGTTPELRGSVVRWDAAGARTDTTMFTLPVSDNQYVNWFAGPAGEGALFVATYTSKYGGATCEQDTNLLVRVHDNLTFEQTTLELQ